MTDRQGQVPIWADGPDSECNILAARLHSTVMYCRWQLKVATVDNCRNLGLSKWSEGPEDDGSSSDTDGSLSTYSRNQTNNNLIYLHILISGSNQHPYEYFVSYFCNRVAKGLR